MSASNFFPCFNETESFEGGFVDNSHDPGGATMAGVTQATYSNWRRTMRLPPASVRNSTVEEREDIYRVGYWNPVHGDQLFTGLDLVMVDTGWGSGDREAIKLLQRCVGVEADGVLGSRTLAAVHAYSSESGLITVLCAARMTFFRGLSTWKWFGKGWTVRLNSIHAKALEMNAAATLTP